MSRIPRVVVIGLDCLTPQLAFTKLRPRMPNLSRLMAEGAYGLLHSTIPPITIPAWTSMTSGKSPGTLGLYGFRNRLDYSYDRLVYATSNLVREDRIWDFLSRARMESVVVGVPQTYPPKPLLGNLVAGFLAPDTNSNYTYPKVLKEEIKRVVGDYLLDVKQFRTESKDALLKQIYQLTTSRFRLVRWLVKSKPWQFFMFVEMGPDRLHHGFWKYFDDTHPKFDPENPYRNAIPDYYAFLDRQLGEFLAQLPKEVTVFVVSDHGAQKMDGGICFNEWLIREGYLVLKKRPGEITRLTPDKVDWSKTKAWGDGGYYGRLFLNVRDREPMGIIAPEEYDAVRRELKAKLEAMPDPAGRSLGNRVYIPQEIYRVTRNVPPDLLVYFGDLLWRSVGSIGFDSIYTFENDTGPDDANHAQHGLFVVTNLPGVRGRQDVWDIKSIAPTILDIFGLPVPNDMDGISMFPRRGG